MVIIAANFARDFNHLLQRMILARVGLGAKAIPRSHAVILDLAFNYTLLQKLKRVAQTLRKLFRRNRRQLRLGIVHVVNVNTIKPQVPQRLSKLILQVPRCHAVRAAGDIGEARDTRSHKGFVDVLPHVSRRRAIKRQVAAFGTNDNFIARKSSCN